MCGWRVCGLLPSPGFEIHTKLLCMVTEELRDCVGVLEFAWIRFARAPLRQLHGAVVHRESKLRWGVRGGHHKFLVPHCISDSRLI